MRNFLVLAITGLLLTCCSGNYPKEGIVYKKEFRKAKKGTKIEKRTKTQVRRNYSVVTEYNVTRRVAYPNRWVLYVISDENDTLEFFAKKEVFDTVPIGALLPLDTLRGTFVEPHSATSSH
ncbi:hypothetical protein [Dysgonomonas sp. 511]|uniref:hypothetical protein n=1 Tax=Dysgonomonas sp. 511 TaxID=2302930 RepID=UPI0013D7CD58|nr:hypothetical protein [Dysgonomonas sp. 511]NDV78424.1 hypothetical protein [Dysgonomonas sp. 511]